MTKAAPHPANRNNDLAAIHMVQKALGMTKEDAQALKLGITGKASAADMSVAQRRMVLAHLSTLQAIANGKPNQSNQSSRPSSRPLADDAQSQKIRALWLTLADAGMVRNRSEAALAAYVKRQTGVEALQWLQPAQASAVIESLKKWLSRQPPKNSLSNGVHP